MLDISRSCCGSTTALLRVHLKSGTRILETGGPPDMKIIDSLKREFGDPEHRKLGRNLADRHYSTGTADGSQTVNV